MSLKLFLLYYYVEKISSDRIRQIRLKMNSFSKIEAELYQNYATLLTLPFLKNSDFLLII